MRCGGWRSACALLSLLLLGLPGAVWACTCELVTPEQSFARAAVVFRGRAVKVAQVKASPDSLEPGEWQEVTFALSRVWKGPVTDRVTVVTWGDGSVCGAEFSEGEEYVVFADQGRAARPMPPSGPPKVPPPPEAAPPGTWSASACARTAPVARAREELRSLAKRKPLWTRTRRK